MLTCIELGHCRRETSGFCRVETAGTVRSHWAPRTSQRYTRLEVCLRLDAETPFAEDLLDGRLCRTPYPHVLYKMPGHRHEYTVEDRRNAVFFIYPARATARLAEAGLLPEDGTLLQPISLTGELRALIGRLNSLLPNSETFSAADRIDLVCWEILAELVFQRRNAGGTVQEKIRRIASRMQTELDGDPDPETLARASGFSPRSFFRHWRKVFPVSPARYLAELKMKRAEYLLTHTGLSVREIAMQLHFRDEHYFSASFRRHFGMTPLACRRRLPSSSSSSSSSSSLPDGENA